MNRSGKYKSNLAGELKYNSFVLSPLPPNPPLVIDEEMIELLLKANKEIAILDLLSSRIYNMNLFIAMYVRKEALLSSQIEGTQVTLEDILDPMIDSNTNSDVASIVNYINTIKYAIEKLRELPICNRLIKETHFIFMNGVRGQDKSPGEFRKSQNWIGGIGSTLKNALFIPPNPEDMEKAMNDLEMYINEGNGLNVLIKAALIHYQFESIHPFLDGNGRIGRLLITLFLIENQVLTSPLLYLSLYLKKNRVEYYDRLSEVRSKGNYEQWVKFFLKGLYESANDGITSIDKLTDLHIKNLVLINSMGRISNNANKLLEYLEENPIIDIKKTADALNLTFNTVSSLINKFIEVGILIRRNQVNRNRIFVYQEYLYILKNGT